MAKRSVPHMPARQVAKSLAVQQRVARETGGDMLAPAGRALVVLGVLNVGITRALLPPSGSRRVAIACMRLSAFA